jgi:F420-dependent oxidoreductase-like protein
MATQRYARRAHRDMLDHMDLRVFTEPQQGASYDDLLRVATATEELGFDAFFRSDHYLVMGDSDGLPGPTDAWMTLAGLARETRRIRLGTLVTSSTFRLPGPLAIAVAQVDAMSGGRVELGLGTGWYDAEHRAYGVPFPPISERFARLEEQLTIITGLWQTPVGQRFDHAGPQWPITDSPALPKPAQAAPPIIVGGHGPTRTPALAARFASEYNIPFPDSVPVASAQYSRVRDACSRHGRDPDDILMSAALVLCCGKDEAEVGRRAAAIGRDVSELREHGLAGTPNEIVDRIGTFGDVGARRIYLQLLDLSDLDHLELVATTVLPQV